MRRPAEMVPAMSSCFEQICLGEAQAVFAYHAARKGSSPGAVASLQMGASDIFEKASKILRENTGQSLLSCSAIYIVHYTNDSSRLLHIMSPKQHNKSTDESCNCCAEGSFNLISDELRRFVAISSSLHCCHAYQHIARRERAQTQTGKAVKCCQVWVVSTNYTVGFFFSSCASNTFCASFTRKPEDNFGPAWRLLKGISNG